MKDSYKELLDCGWVLSQSSDSYELWIKQYTIDDFFEGETEHDKSINMKARIIKGEYPTISFEDWSGEQNCFCFDASELKAFANRLQYLCENCQ